MSPKSTDPRAAAATAAPTSIIEDYLERIHELIEAKGYARPIEIAAALRISQSSVTRMMQRLHEMGFVVYEKHRGLTLTEEGRRVALDIRKRHCLLERFLILLGVDDEPRDAAIEGIEHHLPPEALARLAALTSFLESRPDLIAEFREEDR
jgi:Mn-dependent DtxR family transcriptional regulator